MKKILILLILIVSGLAGFSQTGNDTTKYTWYKFTYGERFNRVWGTDVMDIPNDTIFSKYGISKKGGNLYLGDGIKWNRVTGNNLYNSDGILTANRHVSGSNTHTLNLDSMDLSMTKYDGTPFILSAPSFGYLAFGDYNATTSFPYMDFNTSDSTINMLAKGIITLRAFHGLQPQFAPTFGAVYLLKSQEPAIFANRNVYLPYTANTIDTLATLSDVRAGGGGGGAADVVTTYASGSTLTQGSGANYIQVNPASVQSALTITTLASGGTWHTSNDLYIIFGGTVTSSNSVITTFNLTAGSGMTLVQAISPNGMTYYAGEMIRYHKVGTLLYRIN